MRLADFIEAHRDEILADWDGFAKSLGSITAGMSVEQLRDHASSVLDAILADIRNERSGTDQTARSRGQHDAPLRALTAASIHGTGRQNDGFTLLQLTAEFRSLRASVLRLWLPTVEHADPRSVEEMIRFNESLDQAIAESVSTFNEKADEARDVFLAMLGHDLRSPLHAIGITAEYFKRDDWEPARRTTSLARIKRSVVSMTTMVNDLLEFSRLQLGGSLPIKRTGLDLTELARRLIDDAEAAHPACALRLVATVPVRGEFDGDRLLQMFSNLLNNACQYSERGSTITMTVQRDDANARIEIQNYGSTIAPDRLDAIFNLMHQLKVDESVVERPRTSMGLGLFVARRIAEAHGGTLTVASSDAAGTTFTVTLPLTASPAVSSMSSDVAG